MKDDKSLILVVDDVPDNLILASDLLKDFYKVKVANSGKSALAIAQAEPPDLILLDVVMPEMDGYETCSRLKADPVLKQIPVMFLTALGEIEDEEKGFALGAVDYIIKPLTPSLLLARVKTHLLLKHTLDSLDERNMYLETEITRRIKEIQERSRTQEILAEANKKLKELDRMKSMFIASMSHELRTPLNSIIGFTGLTLQEMSGPLNEEQKDNLSRVRKAANHLLALIIEFIDISKIDSGKVESTSQSFSLDGLVTEAIDTLRTQIQEKGMLLEVQPGPDISMFTDRRRLLQCLINFLSNAVKYSESGKITIGITQFNGEVELSVSDTGIGIAVEDLPKLIEPFERVKSHLQVKAGGAGLGLYLTKKLATEILHGEVSVESIKDVGSTFRIRVPKSLMMEVTPSENRIGN